ncbi:choice-of-anchor D domain-containing protein [Leptospira jelokensis]|uniref:Choice-of-anchor D domain-containing protein n=1 Tax=Leptospira jelokensis TaxID=2484931 RepID=A0A4Z0ZXB4_9LEPT|nr:choice-of-anchor D domain-containing protein [Leptospira jelokensis]
MVEISSFGPKYMQKKNLFIPLISLFTLISCPGGGGGGGGSALALLGFGGGGGGDVAAPKLEVWYSGVVRESGATIDIGSEPVNTTDGKTGTVTIKNAGTASITLPGSPNIIEKSGTNASEFTITQPSSSTLAAGQSVTFTINFKPTTIGSKSAILKIQSSDPAVSSFQMNLTGTAEAATPRLAVSVGSTQISANGSYSMGSVEVDSVGSAIVFTVKNTGSLTANLDSPAVTSSNARFVVNLAGFPATLAPDATATFTIQFSPLATGSQNSSIAVNYDGALSFLFTASATGTPKPVPTIAISHNSTNYTSGGTIPTFGIVWPTLTSTAKTVTISNTGTATMTGITITKESGDTSQFTTSAFSTGATLAAGASGTFTIQFTPSTSGAKNAVVRIATSNGNNGSASSADLAVTGTGKTGTDVLVTWNATNEKAPNDTDGGYRICYSQTNGFTPSHNPPTVICENQANAGGTTSNSKVITVTTFGTWYFKVYSYGKYNTTGGTPSSQVSVTVPST